MSSMNLNMKAFRAIYYMGKGICIIKLMPWKKHYKEVNSSQILENISTYFSHKEIMSNLLCD